MRISDWSSDVCSSDLEIVEMVLAGSINKQIVTAINGAGGTGIGLSGKDGRLIEARKLRRSVRDPGSNIEKLLDLGFVGEPVRVNPEILRTMQNSNLIPVVAPIGIGENGETYNINADTSAGAIAAAVGASRSEEHTSELQSLMRISYAVFCLK